jgi:DNA helicase-2/ATP-dependent DNA helicase PcrA
MRRVSEVVSRSSASSSAPASAAPHPSLSDIREGSVIEHERFGVGEIIKLEGSGENAKATVLFRHTGTKQLLLKFARFKVVK